MGEDAFVSLPLAIGGDNLRLGEKIVERIIQRIHPTEAADQRRGEVVEYVRRLIRDATYAETFSFGSVPLKTYLPDGDIDLTVISLPSSEESLARDVLSILQLEEQSRSSMFDVRDVQYIHAEVKLVKCLVENIVVDISFQRVGGLCTLCFLEKVDRIIGKNHLFKRSILLIKTWCYYESRILGAHHGLISTYALETLILYIFHLYYPSLAGPLEVLFRFLDYFSQFDWLNKGISLSGPVLLDSTNKLTDDDGVGSLLSRDFLRKCEEDFGFPSKFLDDASHSGGLFQRKHLNIVDPLKANNNLGRSVNQGNFHRIQSAFKLGAQKLGRILGMPRGRIPAELSAFFINTLERRHCNTGSTTEPFSLFSSADEPDPPSPSAPDFLEELFKDITKLRVSELSNPSSSTSSSSTSPLSMHELPKLSDLAGDYDSCTRNLLYAAGCLERHHSPSHVTYDLNVEASSYCPSVAGLGLYPCAEDFRRSRGLGTYFPNARSWARQDRRLTGRGRGQRHARHSGVREKGSLCRRPIQSNETLPLLPQPDVSRLEFGSIGAVRLPLPLPLPSSEKIKVKKGLADESEGESVCRLAEGYRLKDEDFPPLGGLVKWNE